MKNKLKVLSTTLAAIMLLGAVSGCGKNEEKSDVATVTVWTPNSHSQDVVTAYVNDWNDSVGKEKGIKIEYVVQGGDSFDKTIELALQNGTAADIIGGGNMTKLADNGNILALDDIPGGEDFIKPYKEAGKLEESRGMHKDKTYAVPCGVAPQGMVYNKDLFKKAGIVDENGEAKPPKTWSEVREYARVLTDKSKNQYGIIAPMKWGGWFGSDINNPAMSLCGFIGYNPATGQYDYSAYKKPMEAWLGMKEDGSIYPGAESLDNDSARAMFAEGNIGMKFAFNFDVGVLNDQFPAKCDWGVCAYPINEDGTGYKQRMDYGWSSFINAASKVEPEKLLEVVKMFSSAEYEKKMFEECVAMPYNTEIIEMANVSKTKKGWAEFAKLANISTVQPRNPQMDMSGMEDENTIFMNYIWTGKISVDDGIKKMQENASKAVENYYSTHTDESADAFKVEGWTPVMQ